jgi:hypothetical protein
MHRQKQHTEVVLDQSMKKFKTMRYFILLLTLFFVLNFSCKDEGVKTETTMFKSDTTRWLGAFLKPNDTVKVYYDVVYLERNVNARLDSNKVAYTSYDSTFFIPVKVFNGKDSVVEYISAPRGAVIVNENFDSAIARLVRWKNEHKR